MKYPVICFIFCGLRFLVFASNEGRNDFCTWYTKTPECLKTEFRCLNGEKCVQREMYCDGKDNCGDNSDEKFCSVRSCPEQFESCSYGNGNTYYYQKCIPKNWKCNGYKDCINEKDEYNCDSPRLLDVRLQSTPKRSEMEKVVQWVTEQRKELTSSATKWGSSVDRLAMILYYADDKFDTSKPKETELANELRIKLLSSLLRLKLSDFPSTTLASYINAFLVMCINPSDFYGYNIVQELRHHVDQENFTNPYVYLALCNAGEIITETDRRKLTDTFENKQQVLWTGTQAVVVMALACANKQLRKEDDTLKLIEMTWTLKQQQHTNGTMVDLPTTALVMQALISTSLENDPEKFDQMKAYEELLRNQQSDGSFGDVMSTFLVTPVLTCNSLMDINSDHCKKKDDKNPALEDSFLENGPATRVQYSFWIGEKKNIERNLVLRVPQNTSLYGVMERAAEIDSRFKFEYSRKNTKPYITVISEMRNDPLAEKYWFLYFVQNEQPALLNESPADIIPNDKDHYVMWYRRGTWFD